MRRIGLAVVLALLSQGLALAAEAQPAGKVVTIGILSLEAPKTLWP